MRPSSAVARVASLICLCLAALAGCSDSPLWQYDKYDVRGSLDGSSCRIAVNGRPVPPDTTGLVAEPTVLVVLDYASNMGLPPGQGAKLIRCNGFHLSFAAPIDSLPTPGEYQVSGKIFDYRPGVVSAWMHGASIGGGLWPFGGDVYVGGYEGIVHLDSMNRKQAWARFELRGRRRHGGE